ncbi:MAG: signal peptidase II [Planctomycetota bacterium]|jgi:signal peptidase II
MESIKKEADKTHPTNRALSSGSKKPHMPGPTEHLIFWPIVILGLWLDLWSKQAVFNWLKDIPNSTYSIIDGLLQFLMAENAGAAFGMAAGKTKMLISVSVVALIVVLIVFFLSGKDRRLTHIGLALFTAGICGNLYDRLFNNGFVRDFIDVYWGDKHWPAFNVADSMLCVGVFFLALSYILTEMPGPKRDRQQK